MKAVKFPYLKYQVTPPAVKPAIYVYRPVIPVTLSMGKKEIRFPGLVDSGADESTFPAWIAKTLGHDLYAGKKKIFSGIGGSVLSYQHRTQIMLEEIKLEVDIYYSHEWDDMPFGLLGQASFFSHFDICFNYREKFISLKY
jgi:hypothetical protein